ncbi:MAG: Fe-S cluster assembly ATPase SufC [Prochlorococcus marinus CUG1439]|uniref:Fe-S cluster assembly ATPase SufC n=1 Tax=Prochlorococcus sp. MIT 1314 TaxID=3096220 RepID=UPI001B06EB48|nr:Fe-S cluster assembly ATPase SufC [Prochlorococcus sp. MIT 1314]MCR8539365.1 Fe-S cluster assembly ATPase SufC [Prochlorococcus marinus CUG1439]
MQSNMKESNPILEVQNLFASTDNLPILKGVSINVYPGEIHAIMGRNGCGKSTLSKIIAGHPSYHITKGDIKFSGKTINSLEPEERAQSGIFLGFQYPIEIPGVSNLEFLRVSTNARRKFLKKEELDTFDFEELVKEKLELVKMDNTFLSRSVNQGFSGGEKKRNEILQMALLEPKISILDETDSGLDIDALRIVASGIKKIANPQTGIILITHYQRLLDEIKPDFVHVMADGKIIKTGGSDLALELEKKGYEWTDNLIKET